jgi:excisionase family DNA binding protein
MERARGEIHETAVEGRLQSPALAASQRRVQPGQYLTVGDVMTAAEVAALLGVPSSTVHLWARQGTLPSRKLGKRRIFIRQKIEALLLDDAAA